MLTIASWRRTVRLTRLTSQAWLALVGFDIARLGGFARLHDRLRRCAVRACGLSVPVEVDEVIWAVEEACVWYVKRALCLQRSAIATRLLRRHGICAELVIGYRPLPFESHAWVEVDGRVVNDRQQYQKAFTVLERL
jgi:hypothetical protein